MSTETAPEAPEVDEMLVALQTIARAQQPKNTPSAVIGRIQDYIYSLTQSEDYNAVQKEQLNQIMSYISILVSVLIDK